jgi:hypothetical protein
VGKLWSGSLSDNGAVARKIAATRQILNRDSTQPFHFAVILLLASLQASQERSINYLLAYAPSLSLTDLRLLVWKNRSLGAVDDRFNVTQRFV